MFGELPKLFDRNFVIGYFLPISIFIAAGLWLSTGLKLPGVPVYQDIGNQLDTALGITVIGLFSWLGGVFLLAVNRDVLRLLEGYGRLNPARLFHFIEKMRYKRLKTAIEDLDKEYQSCITEQREIPKDIRSKRAKLKQEIVNFYPDNERWVLPTSFGNIIRAFEVYPRVMYGLDAIPGWTRLLGVISEDYRKLVDNSKAIVNFWCNIWLLGLLFLIEYVGILLYIGHTASVWILLATTGIIFIAYLRAKATALEWGDLVKSSFDIFLPDLLNKMKLSSPDTADKQQSLWRKFSQAVIYRDPKSMPYPHKRTLKKKSPRHVNIWS